MSTSWYIGISGVGGCHLDFFTSSLSLTASLVVQFDRRTPKILLSPLQFRSNLVYTCLSIHAENRYIRFWRLPSWISHFRLRLTTSSVVLCYRRIPKTLISPLNFVFMLCLQVEIHVLMFKLWSPPSWISTSCYTGLQVTLTLTFAPYN